MQAQTIHKTEAGRALACATIPEPPSLFTLANFAKKHSTFLTLPGITNQVFKAKTRKSTKGDIPGNGMEEAGAIVRLAGRVLIDEARYFAWVDSLQAGSQK